MAKSRTLLCKWCGYVIPDLTGKAEKYCCGDKMIVSEEKEEGLKKVGL